MVEFSNSLGLQLIDSMGDDERVARAAWVSFANDQQEADPERVAGLLKFLWRSGHNCYDEETEVLTRKGWVPFPQVEGSEEFLTWNLDANVMEYQRPSAVIHAPFSGDLIQLKTANRTVDLLVTPNHRMIARRRLNARGDYSNWELTEADKFVNRSYRVPLSSGVELSGGSVLSLSLADAAVLGFVAADGHVSDGGCTFNLRKERKISWLQDRASESTSFELGRRKVGFSLTNRSPLFRELAEGTYTPLRDRCFPQKVLREGSSAQIRAMLFGYLEGDGHPKHDGASWTCTTVSRQLADDVMEAAAKCGLAASEIKPFAGGGRNSWGGTHKTAYRLNIYAPRNSSPRIGWTLADRAREVTYVPYDGMVHCVTVPNQTLCVRRRGKLLWSGNSPFEHCTLTVRVEAPIFVAREWFRHRHSFNEVSGRYTKLEPKFYVPSIDRPLVQVGKPGAYSFEAGTQNQGLAVLRTHVEACRTAWRAYEEQLELGVAKEVARMVLPVSVYTAWYDTMNLRSALHFLDNRLHPTALHEMRELAGQLEQVIQMKFPLVHAAWRVGQK